MRHWELTGSVVGLFSQAEALSVQGNITHLDHHSYGATLCLVCQRSYLWATSESVRRKALECPLRALRLLQVQCTHFQRTALRVLARRTSYRPNHWIRCGPGPTEAPETRSAEVLDPFCFLRFFTAVSPFLEQLTTTVSHQLAPAGPIFPVGELLPNARFSIPQSRDRPVFSLEKGAGAGPALRQFHIPAWSGSRSYGSEGSFHYPQIT